MNPSKKRQRQKCRAVLFNGGWKGKLEPVSKWKQLKLEVRRGRSAAPVDSGAPESGAERIAAHSTPVQPGGSGATSWGFRSGGEFGSTSHQCRTISFRV
ncbi:hypothetical protein CDAR_73521 [Caerostris darwini]|uniref:Uncharacterized protein n=1 Tax=Caerostris darwini TaxID=1538125 RepID=A0AAV4VKF9_9ARAC|nr:hypothetical protein CDAR_73521 [Caerostris darwini]